MALPLLDVMEPVRAKGAPLPAPTTRACYLYIPNGVAAAAWKPEKVGPRGELLKLNDWMAAL